MLFSDNLAGLNAYACVWEIIGDMTYTYHTRYPKYEVLMWHGTPATADL